MAELFFLHVRDLLVKVRDAQATTDIQATEPEGWEDIENISDHSDSSSSEEDEPVLPSKSLYPFIRLFLSKATDSVLLNLYVHLVFI
jgi:hypothetical protein